MLCFRKVLKCQWRDDELLLMYDDAFVAVLNAGKLLHTPNVHAMQTRTPFPSPRLRHHVCRSIQHTSRLTLARELYPTLLFLAAKTGNLASSLQVHISVTHDHLARLHSAFHHP
jgi:hypothetical protein